MAIWNMKTTIDLSDALFRKAKAAAVHEGLSLKKLFTQALEMRLRRSHLSQKAASPEWMRAYGALRHLRHERKKIERVIESEFEKIEPEDRA
jgi:predicted transcriptional regulator